MNALLPIALIGALLAWLFMKKQTPLPNAPDAIPQGLDPFEVKVRQFAIAIAHAEGYYVSGSIPQRFNNPGDLGPGDTGYSGVETDGSNVSQLPDAETGWNLLYNKIRNAFNGSSHVFSTSMTITQFAQKYAGDWQNWSKNVAAQLGVSPDTVIANWIAS